MFTEVSGYIFRQSTFDTIQTADLFKHRMIGYGILDKIPRLNNAEAIVKDNIIHIITDKQYLVPIDLPSKICELFDTFPCNEIAASLQYYANCQYLGSRIIAIGQTVHDFVPSDIKTAFSSEITLRTHHPSFNATTANYDYTTYDDCLFQQYTDTTNPYILTPTHIRIGSNNDLILHTTETKALLIKHKNEWLMPCDPLSIATCFNGIAIPLYNLNATLKAAGYKTLFTNIRIIRIDADKYRVYEINDNTHVYLPIDRRMSINKL